MRRWLEKNATFLTSLADNPLYQKAVSAHLFAELSPNARLALAVLAAFAQRIGREEWQKASLALDVASSTGTVPLTEGIFDKVVGEILEFGIATRDAGDVFEMHELTAEMFLQSTPESLVDAAYRSVDDHHGLRLFMPNLRSRPLYDQSVVSLDSLEKLRGAIGHFQSLLRRGALVDALYIFSEDLESQLRFRLGELRILKSLVSQVQATYLRLHGTLNGAPLRFLAAELLLHEGHAVDALAVLKDLTADAEVHRCRAVAMVSSEKATS